MKGQDLTVVSDSQLAESLDDLITLDSSVNQTGVSLKSISSVALGTGSICFIPLSTISVDLGTNSLGIGEKPQ